MTSVAKHTILKLLEDIRCASAAYHHRHDFPIRFRMTKVFQATRLLLLRLSTQPKLNQQPEPGGLANASPFSLRVPGPHAPIRIRRRYALRASGLLRKVDGPTAAQPINHVRASAHEKPLAQG